MISQRLSVAHVTDSVDDMLTHKVEHKNPIQFTLIAFDIFSIILARQ